MFTHPLILSECVIWAPKIVGIFYNIYIYNTHTHDFCLTVHHQLGKAIQMNQQDATMIY